jgi:Lamin Tail Domain
VSSPGLHICVVDNRTSDSRGEYVEVANDGARPVILTGLELTDYTGTQRRPHIYTFPAAVGNVGLQLGRGNSAFVFTGHGTNDRLGDGDLLLFWGLGIRVWNDDGDVAYLRHPNGTFIDTMTVGNPKRHPNGH